MMTKTKLQCRSEYEPLKKVVVCRPAYMRISNIINETQKHYMKDNINQDLAMTQHEQFRKTMGDLGIEVVELPAFDAFPEQVFTRDIGFTIGNKLFVSEMSCDIRQGEEKVLKNWLKENDIDYHDLKSGDIEGGDVVVDRHSVYVGLGDRTSLSSVEELASLLEGYEVIPLPFQSKYLHLDCVFNVLSEKEALIYSPAFMKNELELLSSRYELIEVTEQEQFTMGTNILNLGSRKVLSLPMNKQVNEALRERGYEVVEVDLSEIIKSGGSFRCCSMPLLREE